MSKNEHTTKVFLHLPECLEDRDKKRGAEQGICVGTVEEVWHSS